MVGRKKACRAETIVHFFEICGARQYVVASVKWIETETIASAEFHPGARHELHQAHGAARRDRMLVASAFNLHDGTNPARRYGKATGRLLDEFGEPIWTASERARSERARSNSKSAEAATRHMNGATATIMRAIGVGANAAVQSRPPTHRL